MLEEQLGARIGATAAEIEQWPCGGLRGERDRDAWVGAGRALRPDRGLLERAEEAPACGGRRPGGMEQQLPARDPVGVLPPPHRLCLYLRHVERATKISALPRRGASFWHWIGAGPGVLEAEGRNVGGSLSLRQASGIRTSRDEGACSPQCTRAQLPGGPGLRLPAWSGARHATRHRPQDNKER
ncbi:hypothetical protein NDU88_001637 [Pleurodeles waltl]|uniref:Uncharacterized protein n=1 Tax=Pleurodeles waltl TaxID=8319 RepID=A0AAV7L174_PLEWA|nr:hypothetical protein NDU88_001637 [Pleurodeles waltl]